MPGSNSNDYSSDRSATLIDYLAEQAASRVEESKRLVEVLRLTIERRYSPDEAVDSALAAVETELILLSTSINRIGEQ